MLRPSRLLSVSLATLALFVSACQGGQELGSSGSSETTQAQPSDSKPGDAPVDDPSSVRAESSGLGSNLADPPPTEVPPRDEPEADAPTDSLPSSDELVVPPGFVVAGTPELQFVIPNTYSAIDLDSPVSQQFSDVDDAGRAALDAVETQLPLGDFSYVSFEFNTGFATTNNMIIVRYPISSVPKPADLSEIYTNQTIDGGGEVRKTELITVDGHDAIRLELTTAVEGQLVHDQFIYVIYGDEFLHEVVVTIRKPVDAEATEQAYVTLDSLRFNR